MSTIAVLGAGASGIIAALKASEKNKVILIENSEIIGKKLLVTGNGRCNYWNENIDITKYHTDDANKLETIISSTNIKETYNFLCSLGIVPKIKNGYYYPFSNQAFSIRTLLEKELILRNIKIITNFKITDIQKKDNKYCILSGDEKILSDKIIISLGSKAYTKSNNTFELLEKLNYHCSDLYPSLVQLRSNSKCLKELNGIRCDAKISLFINDILIDSEEGELQFTDYGLSGISIFNLSSYVGKAIALNQKVEIRVNLLPFEESFSWFENFTNKLGKTISDSLESLISYKLINVILRKCNISKDAYYKSLTEAEKNMLKMYLTEFPFEIYNTNPFEKAQVCNGGISISEVDSNMKSIKDENIYLTGELLDVDGKCGGYNLAFAFISGYLAGKDI